MQVFSQLRGRTEFLAFVDNGQALAAGGMYNSAVHLWDLNTGKLRGILSPPAEQRRAVSFMLGSPDGTRLVVANPAGNWLLWNAVRGLLIGALQGLPAPVRQAQVAFSPDSQHVAGMIIAVPMETVPLGWVSHTELVQWNAITGWFQEHPLLAEIESECCGLAFAPDGQTLAAVHRGGDVIYRYALAPTEGLPACARQEANGRFEYDTPLLFSPDLQTLAFVRHHGLLNPWRTSTLYLWDVAGNHERAKLAGHQREITGLAFSPDGRLLASASLDGTVRFWDVALGKERAAFAWQIGKLFSVVFAPDGMRAAAGGKSDIVVWDVDGC
jgi:WD40 repeat protein